MPELWLTPAPVITKRSGLDFIKLERSKIEFRFVPITLSPLAASIGIIE
jgi:hypothetical protein